MFEVSRGTPGPSRGPTRDELELVRQATLAASSHNTQPWRFRVEPGRISILPDFARRCPEVDPEDHHLFASLGCAAENLLVAARAQGLAGRASFDAARSDICVSLEAAPPEGSALFEAIGQRQCSRSEYDGSALPNEALRALEAAGRGDGVEVLLLTTVSSKEQMIEWVAAGNRAQMGDARWTAEMKKWIRFNGREARRTGDGLYGPAFGMPRVPRWLGELSMRLAVSPERQNRKDTLHLRSSGALAVISSAIDDREHWVEAGRCCERLALTATALGLRTAFINQPVEVPALRAQLVSALGLGSRRPDLLLRIGRGPEMPRSPRRSVQEVLECP